MMRVLDLFSGIGGFSLGLERTGGFRTVAFCEVDGYCRKVLAKHWPEVPIYGDIRELGVRRLQADGIIPDVLCGGFPCQDISVAGRGAGIDGERSGLWSEYARLIGEVRPRFAIVENVAGLLARGLDTVLGDLAALGYDAEWHCIPASVIGAPHRRDRIWVVAYPNSQGESDGAIYAEVGQLLGEIADTTGARLEGRLNQEGQVAGYGWWETASPRFCRVGHGVPSRVDRLRALGNAVVPQIPELIGRAIMAAEAQK